MDINKIIDHGTDDNSICPIQQQQQQQRQQQTQHSVHRIKRAYRPPSATSFKALTASSMQCPLALNPAPALQYPSSLSLPPLPAIWHTQHSLPPISTLQHQQSLNTLRPLQNNSALLHQSHIDSTVLPPPITSFPINPNQQIPISSPPQPQPPPPPHSPQSPQLSPSPQSPQLPPPPQSPQLLLPPPQSPQLLPPPLQSPQLPQSPQPSEPSQPEPSSSVCEQLPKDLIQPSAQTMQPSISARVHPPPPTPQKPPKRPRVIASGGPSTHRNDVRSSLIELAVNPSHNAKICAFCTIPGSRRECEGKLLGPFQLPARGTSTAKSFYAHANCALWAPEVYEGKDGRLKDVYQALLRSRKRKCLFCGQRGASLACMHRNNMCCRPMHFRCALLDEACLREGFKTFCPHHVKSGTLPSDLNEDREAFYIDRTPVSRDLLTEGKGCTLCDADVYDTTRGPILTCAGCCSRQHAKCAFPNFDIPAPLAACSYQGNYLCKKCMKCTKCNLSVDSDIYQNNKQKEHIDDLHHVFDDDANEQENECSAVTCIGCGHFAIHTACIGTNIQPNRWRCDTCHVCRHCDMVNVPRSKWNERHQACPECATEIREGGVICPVCEKVYREGENIPMVQCDFCDKWIHAKECGNLSAKEFKQLGETDSKYRCPICTVDKKKREQERRRSKGSTAADSGSKKSERRDITLNIAEFVQQSIQYRDDTAFHSVRKAATQGRGFSQVLNDLAIETEICRHCCSSDIEKRLLFCADCGECYHRYCHQWKKSLPEEKEQISNSNSSNSSTSDLLSGNLGVEAPAWLCVQCQTFANLSSDMGHPEENMEIERLTPDDRGGNDSGDSGTGHFNSVGRQDNMYNGTVSSPIEVSSSSEASILSYNAISWPDCRMCVLCDRPEDHETPDGRLIPWASSVSADVSHSWVHIYCAMWSVAVTVHGSTNQCDTLVGPRRAVLALARKSICRACRRPGATLICSHQNCKESYHFHCAKQIGVECEVNWLRKGLAAVMNLLTKPSRDSVNLVNVKGLKILCPRHRNSRVEELDSTLFLEDAQKLLNLQRVVRIADSTGFSLDADPPTKRQTSSDRLVSVRIGSISVLRFGRLIPEVDDFIVNGCLIPLGYCAAKRYWSMVNPGYRCLYFFEVVGSPGSGPTFIIRCSDSAMMKIEDKDPEKAWSIVVNRIKQLRKENGMSDLRFANVRIKGLEAFGLQNSVPIVTQVESMPMAAMFQGRYSLKRVAPRKEKDIIFYDSLAQRYKPCETKQNVGSCARSEGFLPPALARRQTATTNRTPPHYVHMETGNAFQLDVVKDFFASKGAIPSDSTKSREDRQQVKSSMFHSGTARNVTVTENRRSESTDSIVVKKRPKSVAPESSRRTVILRSDIAGWGVFATKDIPAGDLITEYVGELIRPALSDLRERKYTDKGIGCYMFEIEPGVIVDATMKGNVARYINHSCGPNCHSKTVMGENGRRVVAIFAKRRIQRGEELTYDYQFPFDDQDKVKCGCGSAECRGWMN